MIKRFASNALALFSAKVVMLLASMALTMILARYLGPGDFGNLRTAFSLAALIGVGIELGIDKIAIRDCAAAREKSRRYLGNVLVIKLLLSCLGLAAALAAVTGFGYRREIGSLVYLGLGVTVAGAFANSLVFPFRAYEVLGYEAVVKVAKSFLLLGLVLLAVRLGWRVLGVASLYLAAAVFQAVLGWLLVRAVLFTPRLSWEPPLARHLLKGGALLALAILFNSYHEVVRIVVYRLQGAAAAGNYSTGTSLYQALEQLVPLSLVGALFPLISRLPRTGPVGIAEVYHRCGKYLLIVALPFAVFCLLLAERIVPWLFGGAYDTAPEVVRILGPVAVLMLQNYLLFDLMIVARKETAFAVTMGASAVLNILCAPFLIVRWGPAGGAAAVGIAQLFSLITFTAVLRKAYHAGSVVAAGGRPLLGAVLLAGAVWWGKSRDLPLALLLLAGGGWYGLSLWLLGAFDRKDRELFCKLIKFNRGR